MSKLQFFFSKLKAYGSHSVLFLNIKSYAGGTRPWNRKNGNQDINDGLIEVVAIDNLDLAILHAGEPQLKLVKMASLHN